jgi:hypothetical protein
MKTMKQKAGLDTNKRLTNHSARKYLVQKLKDNNVEDTDIMQISGHKSVQSVRGACLVQGRLPDFTRSKLSFSHISRPIMAKSHHSPSSLT